MSRTRRLRVRTLDRALNAAVCICLAFLAFSLGPVIDAARAEPVEGAINQAYYGVPPPPVASAEIPYERFYFEGNSNDQVNKLAGSPSATFVSSAPTDATTVEQTTTWFADDNSPGNPLAAYWAGPYSGYIEGDVEFRWYWASLNATAMLIGKALDVTIFADPAGTAPQPGKVIGRGQVRVQVAPTAMLTVGKIPVKGTVSQRMLIQVVPTFFDTGADSRVLYGSTQYPSGFGIPLSVPEAVQQSSVPQTTAVEYDGEPLQVQAKRVGKDAAEPTVGVTNDGTAFFVAGALNIDSVVYGIPAPEVMRSDDGGLTWRSVQPALPATGRTMPPFTADPYVYVDTTTGRVFNIELYAGCSYLNYSDNGGQSWTTNQVACGDFVNDHQTIVAGKPPPNLTTTGYPNVIYYCFNRVVNADCGRSVDGGRTWLPTPGVSFEGFDQAAGGLCGGIHGHIQTDSQGRLFVPKGHCGFPWIAISENGGDTWTRVRVSNKFSALGPHHELAVDEADNLYFLWFDAQMKLPFLSRSVDHGRTWSEPILIHPPGVQRVNFPTIAAGAPGRIAITFPGTTSTESNAFRPWNSYVVVSTNALDPNPLFLSTTANDPSDPIHRGVCEQRCAKMFDFLDIVVSAAGEAWATATDTCTSRSNCITNNGPTVPSGGVAPSMDGVAIRQLCGPALRGSERTLSGPGCLVVATGSLAATGGGASLPARAIAAILILGGLTLIRLIRSSPAV